MASYRLRAPEGGLASRVCWVARYDYIETIRNEAKDVAASNEGYTWNARPKTYTTEGRSMAAYYAA